MICLVCAAVLDAYYFLLSDRNEWNTSWLIRLCKEDEDVSWYVALKCSKVMPSIDIDLLPPYYSDWIWCEIWKINILHYHDGTTHIENMNNAWMPLGACCHSDTFQECIHVVVEMQVSEFQACKSLDESLQLMAPSWQPLFCYTVSQ